MNNNQKNNKTETTPPTKQEKLSSSLCITVKLFDCSENYAHNFAKQIVLSLSLVFILSYFASGQQTRWIFIGNDVSGTAFYIEKDSQKSIGKILRVWSKSLYADGSYRINQMDWDCKEKKYFMVQGSNYNPDGSFIDIVRGDVWLDVVPDAVSEVLYKAVCKTSLAGDYEKSSSVRKTVEIIVKKANLRAEPNANSRVIRQAVTGERFVLASESPEKGWYQIIDVESNEIVWIHGNTIKLIEVTNTSKTKKHKETRIIKQRNSN